MNKPELIGMASRLEIVRQEEAMSQEQFADRLGISRGAYINYSKGGREIPSSLIIRLYDKFDVDPVWLVTGNNAEKLNDRDKLIIHVSARLGILFARKIDPLNSGGHTEKIDASVEFALQYLIDDLDQFDENDKKIVEYTKGLSA